MFADRRKMFFVIYFNCIFHIEIAAHRRTLFDVYFNRIFHNITADHGKTFFDIYRTYFYSFALFEIIEEASIISSLIVLCGVSLLLLLLRYDITTGTIVVCIF